MFISELQPGAIESTGQTMSQPAHEQHENAPRTEMQNCSSVGDVKTTLALLHEQEASVTARLDALVASQNDFSRELGRLDLLRARLGSKASNTRAVSHGMLSDAATTAHRISSAVKRLDLEQDRVKSTLNVVEQVAELKACVLGVAGSLGVSQDWETAAGYISRASKIPREVVNGSFAAEIVPTAEVPDPPSVTLENAAESLCGLFLREFDRAVKENDGAKITRFFKLFPLVGRSSVGLDVYGRYVCQGVASRARTNLHAGTGGTQAKDGFFYANALTRLFEHIAQIVDGHGGLVERHYGSHQMVRVMERLQVEANVQGGIILESWSEERHVDRKLTDIKSYAFTFLVQSFMPAPRGAGTPRANSPAYRDGVSQRQSEEEGVDMKEIDSLLNEMSVMLAKWSLYEGFLADKCKDEDEEEELRLPGFVVESPLLQKIKERVIGPYNTMTTFFLRRSVEKAFQLDEAPPGLTLNRQRTLPSNGPHITSAVDDIMYIVNKVLQQSLGTGQISIVHRVTPTVARVLGSDFVGMIQRKMRDETYPKPAVAGGMPPEGAVVSFLVLINNLDVAVDYVQRIVRSHIEGAGHHDTTTTTEGQGSALAALFPLDREAAQVSEALQGLALSFEAKAQDLLGDGIQVVYNNVIKTRLRPLLSDAFRDIEYLDAEDVQDEEIEGEEGGSGGGGSVARRRFAAGWGELLGGMARILTGRAFERVVGSTTGALARLLEKRIWSYHGRVSPLGATRLERDVLGVVTAATTSMGGGSYRQREVFGRCVQVVTVMGLEEEEWAATEREGAEGLADRLTTEETARARAMVVPS